MMILQISSYLFLIVANIVTAPFLNQDGKLRALEISNICLLVIYYFSNFTFGLYVNTIITKIIAADNQKLDDSSLKNSTASLLTESFNEYESVQGENKEDVEKNDLSHSSLSDCDSSINVIEVDEMDIAQDTQATKIQINVLGSVAEGVIATLFKQPD